MGFLLSPGLLFQSRASGSILGGGQLEEKIVVVLDVGLQGCVKQLETVDGEQGVELVGDVALVVVVLGEGHGERGSWSGSAH